MKRDIKMIALDLDGTVLNSKKEMTPAVISAIKRAIAAGIEVLPATGRAFTGVPQEFMDIPGVRYIIAANGASVYDSKTKTVLLSDYFDKETALDIFDNITRWDVSPSVFIENTAYAQEDDFCRMDGLIESGVITYLRLSRQPVPSLRKHIEDAESPIIKISALFYDTDQRPEAVEYFNSRGDCTLTSSLPNNIELNTKTATKGNALLWLAQHLGIQQSQTMAVGDSMNDFAMMKAAGLPVAMGQSHPKILELADFVTKSCDEDGVAHAINTVLDE